MRRIWMTLYVFTIAPPIRDDKPDRNAWVKENVYVRESKSEKRECVYVCMKSVRIKKLCKHICTRSKRENPLSLMKNWPNCRPRCRDTCRRSFMSKGRQHQKAKKKRVGGWRERKRKVDWREENRDRRKGDTEDSLGDITWWAAFAISN